VEIVKKRDLNFGYINDLLKGAFYARQTIQVKFENAEFDNENSEELTQLYFTNSNIYKSCKNCGIPIEKVSGCEKMKCRCGYKFCYKCGVENATCKCTPAMHGYWDNERNQGDFSRTPWRQTFK
jgi:hypothetical protein